MKRPLATIACAVIAGLVMPVFPSDAEPALANPGDHYHDDPDTLEGHTTQSGTGHLVAGWVTTDIGTGTADPDSPYVTPRPALDVIARWNNSTHTEELGEVPCVGFDTIGGLVPENICASYDGYVFGWQVNNHLRNQRVCFDTIGEDPEPSIYYVKDVDISNRDDELSPSDATELLINGVGYPAPYGEPLTDAVRHFNRDRNPDIGGVEPADRLYDVATIPNYVPRRGVIPIVNWSVDYYHWPYTAYPPDMGNGVIWPTERVWSDDLLGMDRTDRWTWQWRYVVTRYEREWECVPNPTPLDPDNMDCRWVVGDVRSGYPRNVTLRASAWNSTPVFTEGDPPLGPGRDPGDYFSAIWTRTDNEPIPRPPAPSRRSPNCTSPYCTSSYIGANVIYDKGSVDWFDAGTVTVGLPAFWKVWQEWGTHEQDDPASEELITQLANQGVGGLDPTRGKEYQISYYTCEVARNGEVIEAWVVGLPFPRLAPSIWTFTTADNAVVGDYVLPPDPQSPPGLRTANADPPMQAAPPVHVPVPLYDIGSGMNLHPPSPDGGWWATVGTIDDETDCLNAGVRICLAKALRPWRAVWYIEPPPPVSVITSTGLIPTTHPRAPSDVRVCYYTDDGALPGVLSDQPREGSGSGSGYEVSVPVPGNAGAMIHALHSAGLADKRSWLTDWLYGSGPNLARAYGQDQVDPDRYCWYKWYQAQNDSDGFEGVLAVEWLATLYIGVPSDPYAYCQGGVKGSHPGVTADPTPFNFIGPGLYNCHFNGNANFYSPRNYWKAVAENWNDPRPGSPSASLFWYGDRIDRFSYCRVGSGVAGRHGTPVRLVPASRHDHRRERTRSRSRRAGSPCTPWAPATAGSAAPRGGAAPRLCCRTRTPYRRVPNPAERCPTTGGEATAPRRWEPPRTRQQTSTTLSVPRPGSPRCPARRLREPCRTPNRGANTNPTSPRLEYPIGTTLAGTGGHRDCDQVPVTVKSLPCQSWTGGACRSTTRNWWDMFHYQVDAQGNPVIVDGEPAPEQQCRELAQRPVGLVVAEHRRGPPPGLPHPRRPVRNALGEPRDGSYRRCRCSHTVHPPLVAPAVRRARSPNSGRRRCRPRGGANHRPRLLRRRPSQADRLLQPREDMVDASRRGQLRGVHLLPRRCQRHHRRNRRSSERKQPERILGIGQQRPIPGDVPSRNHRRTARRPTVLPQRRVQGSVGAVPGGTDRGTRPRYLRACLAEHIWGLRKVSRPRRLVLWKNPPVHQSLRMGRGLQTQVARAHRQVRRFHAGVPPFLHGSFGRT